MKRINRYGVRSLEKDFPSAQRQDAVFRFARNCTAWRKIERNPTLSTGISAFCMLGMVTYWGRSICVSRNH